MRGVIEFYRDPPEHYRTAYRPGQFYHCWIPFPLSEAPRRLVCEHYDPKCPEKTWWCLRETRFATFHPEYDPSLKALGLKQDDFLLSVGYKKRPAILVSDPLSGQVEVAHQYQGHLVVPLYSTTDEMGNYKKDVNREQILRASAYQLPNVFYLPACDQYGILESFARLDRMQFVRAEHLSPKAVSLTDEATDLLREWAWHFLGAPLLHGALEEFIAKSANAVDKLLGEEPV